jgi:glycerol kinase
MAPTYILAIDQGTTSSRAILFGQDGEPAAVAQAELPQHYPADGWVEHDADRIWNDTVAVVRGVVDKAGVKPADVAAIGITNQRETAVIWNRKTGALIHRAIVWQDRRTAELCRTLNAGGHGKLVPADRSVFLGHQDCMVAG